jgi:hypothetical protein
VHAYDLGDLGVELRERNKKGKGWIRGGGLGFQTWVGILGCYTISSRFLIISAGSDDSISLADSLSPIFHTRDSLTMNQLCIFASL